MRGSGADEVEGVGDDVAVGVVVAHFDEARLAGVKVEHAQAEAKYPGTPASGEVAGGTLGSSGSGSTSPASEPVGGSTSGTTYYSPSAENSEADGMLLNYLLGN